MPWKPGKILREKGKRSLTEMYIMDQLWSLILNIKERGKDSKLTQEVTFMSFILDVPGS
jgi:hypothetical protein